MVTDFFAEQYRTEMPRSNSVFGICDPVGERPAYTAEVEDGTDKWCAQVDNPATKQVHFVPIDKNILFYKENGDLDSSCDGMLFVPECDMLAFVELKDVRKQWINKAVSQLKITIARFLANTKHPSFKHQYAFACNRKHRVNHSQRELQQEFKRSTGFSLSLNYRISTDTSI